MRRSKKAIEFWRVQSIEGAYYTLRKGDGELQDFLKFQIPFDLKVNDKVAVGCKNGLKFIMKKVSDFVTVDEATALITNI